jgi:hypothetical protein
MERAWLMTFYLRMRAEIAHKVESGTIGAPPESVNLIRVNL